MDEHRQRETLSFEKTGRTKQRSIYLRWSLKNPILVGAAIIIIMVCIILIIGNNLGGQTGIITKSDIGTIAEHDYKAPRDFTFDRVDREATERIREQRISEVLPIFKWDKSYHSDTQGKIQNTFNLMRTGLTQEKLRLSATRVKREQNTELAQQDEKRQAWADALLSPFADEPIFDPYLSTRPMTPEEIQVSLNEWISKHREDFVQSMGYVVDDSLYQWLAEKEFSEEIENSLVQVFDVVLGRMIISTSQEIENVQKLNVQWYENNDKNQKIISESEKINISTLSSSQSLVVTLINDKIKDVPESFIDYFKQFVRPNMSYDEAATQRERQNVSDKTAELRIIEEFKKGQTIVGRGDPIKQSHFEIYEKIAQIQGDNDSRTGRWIGLTLIILVMFLMTGRSITSGASRRQKNRDILYMAIAALIYTVGLKLSLLLCNVLDSVYHWPYSILLFFPFAGGPMLVRIVINRAYSYLFAILSIVLTSLVVEDNIIILSYAIVCCVAGCLLMDRPKRTNTVIRRGLLLGLLSGFVALSIYLLRNTNLTEMDYSIMFLLGIISGLLSSGVVMIGLPLAESIFGYVTSNKLLELSNLEHPALKTLFIEAPGTYQHSIMVGSLNEAAAEAIGANAILARVGGYYHDIGKIKNAQYFAENQRGDNPHNRLKPNMSALILKRHEQDGLEIAKKYHLPQDIMDFIATHHGTSRIEYFYQRAKDQQDRVSEEDYRYPGPRPQTRETGICMVSDMVEAAVRSLPDKSPDKILVLVHKLINNKFTDGQFDECDLTLHDLNEIANALLGILNAFYHHRPEYPDQKREREKIEAERRDKNLGNDDSKTLMLPKVSAGNRSKEDSSTNISKNTEKLPKVDVSDKQNKTSRSESFEKISKSTDKAKKASSKSDDKMTASSAKLPVILPEKTDNNRSNSQTDKASSKDNSNHKIEKDSNPQDLEIKPETPETSAKGNESENHPSENIHEEDTSNSPEETLEANELLKEENEENEEQNDNNLSVHDAYDLTFSSKVDVFKKG